MSQRVGSYRGFGNAWGVIFLAGGRSERLLCAWTGGNTGDYCLPVLGLHCNLLLSKAVARAKGWIGAMYRCIFSAVKATIMLSCCFASFCVHFCPPWPLRPMLSAHTAASWGRQLLHLMPLVAVVQKGHILVVCGAAAGISQAWNLTLLQQNWQGQVMVAAGFGAASTAVFEEDGLLRVVTQAQVLHVNQQALQMAFSLLRPFPCAPLWAALGCAQEWPW